MKTTEPPCGCVVQETPHYKLTKHCAACMQAIIAHENRYQKPANDNRDLVGG